MDIGTLSMRYAKALIAYAQEEKVEDKLYEEVKMLSRSYAKFPQLRDALTNPMLTSNEKLKLICTAANGEKESSEQFTQFIRLVLKQKREIYLLYMCLTYMHLYYQMKHIAVGTLITATPVDDRTKERIRNAAAVTVHAEMRLQTLVDPSIGGGFIFDINDYRLDASIATQLKRVKQQFIDKNRRII